MFSNTSIIILITFIISMINLSIQLNHFLMSLFCLEAMMLSSMLLITMLTCMNSMFMPHLSMLMLTLGACEASIGLSLMVCMTRLSGSDLMMNMTMNKC